MADLSFEEYAAWCRSRVPALSPGSGPESTANTWIALPGDEACPVTVRSVESRAVITPRSKGSK